MTRAASALVREVPDGRSAAAAAARSASAKLGAAPDAAVVFATPHHRHDAAAILEELRRAGCRCVYGGCASGVLTDEGESEEGPALALLLLRDSGLSPIPASDAPSLRRGLPENALALVLPDPAGVELADLARDFDAAGPFRELAGGALSGGSETSGHFQFAGDRVERKSLAAAALAPAWTRIGVSQGCRPIGRPLVVTRSQGNVVLGLAGRPPLEILRATLEEHAKSGGKGGQVMVGLAMDSAKSPLGRGDFVVRNFAAVQSEQGEFLALGSPVRTGQTLVFHMLDRTGAVEDAKAMVSGLREKLPGSPAFGLYFNCRGRGRGLYGETDHDVLEIRAGLGGFPIAGFFGNGEFAPVGGKNWMHNYTGVLVVGG